MSIQSDFWLYFMMASFMDKNEKKGGIIIIIILILIRGAPDILKG